MKSLLSCIVLAVTVLSFGCGESKKTESSEETLLSILPSSLSVAIPQSLSPSTVSAELEGVSISNSSVGSLSYGYLYLKGEISAIKSKMFDIGRNMVIIDEVLSTISPSSSLQQGRSVTITDGICKKILAIVPEGLDKSEIALMLDSYKGRQVSIPNFYYQATTEFDGYDYSFEYGTESDPDRAIVLWSSDKKRIKVCIIEGGFKTMIVNDITSKTTRMYSITSSSLGVMTMKGNGDDLHTTLLNQVWTDLVGGSNFSIEGIADDNGGVSVTNRVCLNWADFYLQKNSYVEGFDKAGSLTYQSIDGVETGTVPTMYKDKYIAGITEIDNLKSDLSDANLYNNSAWLSNLTGAKKGDCFVIFNSDIFAAVTTFNENNGDTMAKRTITSSIIASAYCDKSETACVFLSADHPEYYTQAKVRYIYKIDVSSGTPSILTLTHFTDLAK
jgi:hypothetical protein